jgi:hypothetical protein
MRSIIRILRLLSQLPRIKLLLRVREARVYVLGLSAVLALRRY